MSEKNTEVFAETFKADGGFFVKIELAVEGENLNEGQRRAMKLFFVNLTYFLAMGMQSASSIEEASAYLSETGLRIDQVQRLLHAGERTRVDNS